MKERQAQFCDILVSVDLAMLSSVLKLNLVLPHSPCVDVGLWNADQNFVIINQQLNEVGFLWYPAVLRATREVELFSHYGSFTMSMKKIHKH